MNYDGYEVTLYGTHVDYDNHTFTMSDITTVVITKDDNQYMIFTIKDTANTDVNEFYKQIESLYESGMSWEMMRDYYEL